MSDFPFDAVIFDCDGVLVDSEPITNRVIAEMLNELGWPIGVEETMRIFVGKTVRDEAARIEAHTGFAVTSEWLAQFRARRNEALERDLVEIRGAPDAVRALHRTLGGRIAVASGADKPKVDMQLAKIDILECFDGHVFSGHDMARSKPYPDVYLAAAEALGVDPARCAVVEDTATGVTAGVAAGATVFGYSPKVIGQQSPDALRAAGAVAVFEDMTQLHALLAGWTSSSRAA